MTTSKDLEQLGDETLNGTSEPARHPPSYNAATSLTISATTSGLNNAQAWGNPLKDDKSFKWQLVMQYKCHSVTDTKYCEWHARVGFRVKDLPQHMREGLYWTSGNCKKELSHYSKLYRQVAEHTVEYSRGYRACRQYTLFDHSNPCQWYAEVRVLSSEASEKLRDFRLERLDSTTLYECDAYNPDEQMVYHWRENGPASENINSIYDDMPMQGVWPWPKAEKEDNSANGKDTLGYLQLMDK